MATMGGKWVICSNMRSPNSARTAVTLQLQSYVSTHVHCGNPCQGREKQGKKQ